jgi:hypothetical protein
MALPLLSAILAIGAGFAVSLEISPSALSGAVVALAALSAYVGVLALSIRVAAPHPLVAPISTVTKNLMSACRDSVATPSPAEALLNG